MTLPKALSDPGCQLCQAQIIWALHYRSCCLLALHNPLISLGLGGGWKPALFSNIVIKEDKGAGATVSDRTHTSILTGRERHKGEQYTQLVLDHL